MIFCSVLKIMFRMRHSLIVFVALGINFINCDKNAFPHDISVHVLDTNTGRPASNVPVTLFKLKNDADWVTVSKGLTEVNGRYADFSSNSIKFTAGTYKMTFETKKYFAPKSTLYPYIDIIFDVTNANEHYHIPLLLNAYGYTTYRGQ